MLNYVIILLSSIFAACGQILLKMGAHQKIGWVQFINWFSVFGCLCYAIGLLLWIYSLSKLPLTVAYIFTMVTFILVYVLNWLLLGEHISKMTMIGIGLISIGMAVIYVGQTEYMK